MERIKSENTKRALRNRNAIKATVLLRRSFIEPRPGEFVKSGSNFRLVDICYVGLSTPTRVILN